MKNHENYILEIFHENHDQDFIYDLIFRCDFSILVARGKPSTKLSRGGPLSRFVCVCGITTTAHVTKYYC